jgi:hypothetical protein
MYLNTPLYRHGIEPGVVSEPDAEVLDLEGLALGDLLHAHDLSGRLLELAELPQEIPEPDEKKIVCV